MKNLIIAALFLTLPFASLNAQDFFSNSAQESQTTVQSGSEVFANPGLNDSNIGTPDQGTDSWGPGAPINQYVLILGLVGLGLGGYYLTKRNELIKE